jgi:hypothetical protein
MVRASWFPILPDQSKSISPWYGIKIQTRLSPTKRKRLCKKGRRFRHTPPNLKAAQFRSHKPQKAIRRFPKP